MSLIYLDRSFICSYISFTALSGDILSGTYAYIAFSFDYSLQNQYSHAAHCHHISKWYLYINYLDNCEARLTGHNYHMERLGTKVRKSSGSIPEWMIQFPTPLTQMEIGSSVFEFRSCKVRTKSWPPQCLQMSKHLTVLGHRRRQWWLQNKAWKLQAVNCFEYVFVNQTILFTINET